MKIHSSRQNHFLKSIVLVVICCQLMLVVACGGSKPSQAPQSPKGVVVDWHARLTELQNQLASNPNSAFLHSQVAVAYNGLGDIQNFEREIDRAIQLDNGNSVYWYFAFAVYKQRDMRDKEILALDSALKIDSNNPFGHYQRASIFEAAKDFASALAEFQTCKKLLDAMKANPNSITSLSYVDPLGNPYDVAFEKAHIDDDIARIRRQAQK